MNQQPPSHPDESVTTEPQRLALERMSAELIHNLNVMIAEQEERVRIFAEQHHSSSPLPQQPAPEKLPEVPDVAPAPASQPESAKPLVARFKAIARRDVPPLVTNSPNDRQEPQPRPIPIITKPRKTTENKEESSIGVGTIVTFIVIILFLLRACS